MSYTSSGAGVIVASATAGNSSNNNNNSTSNDSASSNTSSLPISPATSLPATPQRTVTATADVSTEEENIPSNSAALNENENSPAAATAPSADNGSGSSSSGGSSGTTTEENIDKNMDHSECSKTKESNTSELSTTTSAVMSCSTTDTKENTESTSSLSPSAPASSNTNSAASNTSTTGDETEPTSTNSSNPGLMSNNNGGVGWRVKLYRLNADGSWDDCGTGRICFHYSAPKVSTKSLTGEKSLPSLENEKTQNATSSTKIPPDASEHGHTHSTASNTNDGEEGFEELLYRKLNNPVLCMQAEAALQQHAQQSGSDANNSNSGGKVLLNNRVLLQDVYQRQGENIITWCEPFFGEAHGCNGVKGRVALDIAPIASAGVDLALSFQDNAGCSDIWAQITGVQKKALELMRIQHGESGLAAASLQNDEAFSLGGNNNRIARSSSSAAEGSSALADGSKLLGGGANPSDSSIHDGQYVGNCMNKAWPRELGGRGSLTIGGVDEVDNNGHALRQMQHSDASAAGTRGDADSGIALNSAGASASATSLLHELQNGSAMARAVAAAAVAAAGESTDTASHTAAAAVSMAAAAAAAYNPGARFVSGGLLDPQEVHQHSQHLAAALRGENVGPDDTNDGNHEMEQQVNEVSSGHALRAESTCALPHPPTLANLEEIADVIHATVTCPFPHVLHQPQPVGGTGSTVAANNGQLTTEGEEGENGESLDGDTIMKGSDDALLLHQQNSMVCPTPMSREGLGAALCKDNFGYFTRLLGLFPQLEAGSDGLRSSDILGNTTGLTTKPTSDNATVQLNVSPTSPQRENMLATLASVTKCILFLNERPLLEHIVNAPRLFEQLCAVLEYDPELRRKANHRDYLSRVVRFSTVVRIDDQRLVHNIQKCWRITFLKDTVLRPTMEDATLATLSELLTYAHNDVVRGVTTAVSIPTETSSISSSGVSNTSSDDMTPATDERAGAMGHDRHSSDEVAAEGPPGLDELRQNQGVGEEEAASPGSGGQQPPAQNQGRYEDCYLARILRMLGVELWHIRNFRNEGLNRRSVLEVEKMADRVVRTHVSGNGSVETKMEDEGEADTGSLSVDKIDERRPLTEPLTTIASSHPVGERSKKANSCWMQHVLPQDPSLLSRRKRRRGCLLFLKELFDMVRSSLQPSAKDDFYNMICLMDVSLTLKSVEKEETLKTRTVNLVQLLGSIISDYSGDDWGVEQTERSAALDILSGIIMHDPSLIRRHVLDEHCVRPKTPDPKTGYIFLHENNLHNTTAVNQKWTKKPVIFPVAEDDLLVGLISIMTLESDAGLVLQTLEILRVLLDTDLHVLDDDSEDEIDECGAVGLGVGLGVEEDLLGSTAGRHMSLHHAHNHHVHHHPTHPHGHTSEDIQNGNVDEVNTEHHINASMTQRAHQVSGSSVAAGGEEELWRESMDGGEHHRQTHHQHSNFLVSHSGPVGEAAVGGDPPSAQMTTATANPFLSLFYEHYVHWVAAPFQYTIWHRSGISTDQETSKRSEQAVARCISPCPARSSFCLELLCFCVRAHCYRMKNFVLRSRVLLYVMKYLSSSSGSAIRASSSNGMAENTERDFQIMRGQRIRKGGDDRCLKLAVLRFLRSVVSVKDEFYHRHIVQNNLFEPVFEAFRQYPVGENLVSSSIIELCDFIRTDNIRTLLEYIVAKFINPFPGSSTELPSLEDIAAPHVDTFKLLKQRHIENVRQKQQSTSSVVAGNASSPVLTHGLRAAQLHTSSGSSAFEVGAQNESGLDETEDSVGSGGKMMSQVTQNGASSPGFGASTNDFYSSPSVASAPKGKSVCNLSTPKALEDQRKFRQVDEEESYFNEDDDDDEVAVDVPSSSFSAIPSSGTPHSKELDDNDDGIVSSQHGDMQRGKQLAGLNAATLASGSALHVSLGHTTSKGEDAAEGSSTSAGQGGFGSVSSAGKLGRAQSTQNQFLMRQDSPALGVGMLQSLGQYTSSSDDEEDAEVESNNSNSSTSDTDSSGSSLITNTSDVSRGEVLAMIEEEERANKRARTMITSHVNNTRGEDGIDTSQVSLSGDQDATSGSTNPLALDQMELQQQVETGQPR